MQYRKSNNIKTNLRKCFDCVYSFSFSSLEFKLAFKSVSSWNFSLAVFRSELAWVTKINFPVCWHRLFCLCFSLLECDFSALSPILETSIVRSHQWHNAFRLSALYALTQALYWESCSHFLLYKHWPFRPFDSMTNSMCTRPITL